LNTGFSRRSPAAVVEEIRYWHRRHGVGDFAFYDDALLVSPDEHAVPLLEGIAAAGLPVRFHTPNALHIREISAPLARLMKRVGFETIRLGLETTAFADRAGLDAKVTASEFRTAVNYLRRAGFERRQVGAYLLAGLPGQDPARLKHSFRMVQETGITPIMAYYSPIPGTRLWEEAKAASRYDLEADPVYHNNSIFPCLPACQPLGSLRQLKEMAANNVDVLAESPEGEASLRIERTPRQAAGNRPP
jgi:radical SAM superfamily enzyme YgiQ (UPF0313 family)